MVVRPSNAFRESASESDEAENRSALIQHAILNFTGRTWRHMLAVWTRSVELIGIAECAAIKPESVCTHLQLNLFYGDRYKVRFN